jgi:hypothetical protein
VIKKIFGRRQLDSYLLFPGFQLTIICYALAASVVIIGTFYFTNHYLVSEFIAQGKSLGLEPTHPYFIFMTEFQKIVNKVFWWTLAMTFLLLPVGGIFLSHRVAGPLHRLREHMKGLAQGKSFKPVSFRKKDYFQELVKPYNDIVSQLESKKNKQEKAG